MSSHVHDMKHVQTKEISGVWPLRLQVRDISEHCKVVHMLIIDEAERAAEFEKARMRFARILYMARYANFCKDVDILDQNSQGHSEITKLLKVLVRLRVST